MSAKKISDHQVKPLDQIPILIKDLYRIVDRLERMFPGRHFKPDGHLVGSIGEVLAAHYYGLELLPNSFQSHDAKTLEGQLVQIKATQRATVALRDEPNYLIVLLLKKNGSFEEVYNGPGKEPWNKAGKMQKNGQRPISLSKLRSLMETVPISHQIPVVGSQPLSR